MHTLTKIDMPIDETFSMDPSEYIVVYPSYLDSTKTVKEGRRIGQEKAVETPTVSDISQALQSLQIKHVLQPHKGYSRDIETLWENPGRVKVDPSRTDVFESKRQLLAELAKIIPTLPSRKQRLEHEKQQAILEAKQAEEEALRTRQAQKQLQQQQQKSSGKTNNKKKGKKKR